MNPFQSINDDFFTKMDDFGKENTPFLFGLDFELNNGFLIPLAKLDTNLIQFEINNTVGNTSYLNKKNSKKLILNPKNIKFKQYNKVFDLVKSELNLGNTYLCNLTFNTPVTTNWNLKDFYTHSYAQYKIWVKDQFVCFSPETFVKIINGKIYSYPMKGTINADLPNAEKLILINEKEKAEHATIVDLIRNDLSQVADHVMVSKYRFVQQIKTSHTNLLQVSSQIEGTLTVNYQKNIGQLFKKILPAGSVCGAPKAKTIDIIKAVEDGSRNFYTGVFGVFDGVNLDSAVMIRFVEETAAGLVFKTGGGITNKSISEEEYNEMNHKIYVPII